MRNRIFHIQIWFLETLYYNNHNFTMAKFYWTFGILLVSVAFVSSENKAQTRGMMSFVYDPSATAAYPEGTTIVYSPGATVDYIAGASVAYMYSTSIEVEQDTEIYTQTGPKAIQAGQVISLPAQTQLAFGPGTSVTYRAPAETRYFKFNGNTHALAQYPNRTSVQYYYGPNGSNLILFPSNTIPLKYYNPGGSTQFGPSPVPVEIPSTTRGLASARTYGYGCRGGGYSYCSGYSYNGYPQTTYYAPNYGYSYCYQSAPMAYSYGPGPAYNYGGAGGGAMGGGGSGGGYYGK